MDQNIENRLNQVYWSINLYNLSISELWIISEGLYQQDELKIVNSHTFDFYRVTLQYTFIMEYCKLLEKGNGNNNISSLHKLNQIILSENTNKFENAFNENIKLIDNIKNSQFYLRMKTLRDKKFSHSDNHEINRPFHVEGFSANDFVCAFEHLKIIKSILTSFGKIYERGYVLEIPSTDTRTRNFIKNHAKYESYYMKNYLKAEFERHNPNNPSIGASPE